MVSKSKRNPINGWIILNKPLGITSSDAVNKVKWLLKPTKIGHAGTLDPLASGVLPLALGEGTKCINLLMDATKTYEFSVTFGERRATDDAEGEVVVTSEHLPSEAEIRAVLPQFTGVISQMPPAYSALKVNGKRAYDLARAGEEVVLAAREITVHALELLGFSTDEETRAVSPSPCGKGEGGVGNGASHFAAPLPNPPREGEGMIASEAIEVAARRQVSAEQEERIREHSQDLRNEPTDAEKTLWKYLRAEQVQGFKFRRQLPIDHYIGDFVCLERRLIVELDGGQHTEEADAKRSAYLQSQGFRIIRFWNHEVLENIDGVVEAIRAELLSPPTQPSPARGEGAAQPDGLKDTATMLCVAHFRAQVSKGTYIRSLGRDIALAVGSEGYISRLHRASVGPFTDAQAISLDFIEESVHKAPPNEGTPEFVLPLHTALDDIPALALTAGQLATLRHGQQVSLTEPHPDTPLLGAMHDGQLVGLVKVEGNRVVTVRLLNI